MDRFKAEVLNALVAKDCHWNDIYALALSSMTNVFFDSFAKGHENVESAAHRLAADAILELAAKKEIDYVERDRKEGEKALIDDYTFFIPLLTRLASLDQDCGTICTNDDARPA